MTAVSDERVAVEQLIEALAAYTDDDFGVMTVAELVEYQRHADQAFAKAARLDEDDWAQWLRFLFPNYFREPFGEHHAELWRWVWAIELGVRPAEAFVAAWPRGGAKSTSAEAAVAALGARGRRNVVLYVCETQSQADQHVANIATLLESKRVDIAYRELGQRLVGKYGPKEWRHNRLRTASGLTVIALGLDAAARGVKIDEDRPDLIVLDDIDSEHDNIAAVERKIKSITQKLLPAGGESAAVLFIQNVPNPHGVMARLCGVHEGGDGIDDFLLDRHVSGPIPAVHDATIDRDENGRWRIVDGTAAWSGQSIDRCNEQISEWGITAFKIEALHETDARSGGMFDHIEFAHCTPDEVPELLRHAVWVDPAVTNTDQSDAHGCQVDALDMNGTIYRLRSWERRASPGDALRVAIAWAALYGCRRVGIEVDQGQDTWASVYRESLQRVRDDYAALLAGEPVDGPDVYVAALVELVGRDEPPAWPAASHAFAKAGVTQTSKAGRAQQMLADYEKAGRIVHVLGDHLPLEKALRRFPRTKPFDLTDAAYWSWKDLRAGGAVSTSRRAATARKLPQVPALNGAAR